MGLSVATFKGTLLKEPVIKHPQRKQFQNSQNMSEILKIEDVSLILDIYMITFLKRIIIDGILH